MTSENLTLRSAIRKALTTGQSGTVTVLSSLLAVEETIGYIPPEAIQEVADFTRTTVSDVWGVASFYTNFKFTPPGKHVVEVCWGTSCHLRGAAAVLEEVLDSLELAGEGKTRDKGITFKYNTCLGTCTQAPVISVDHQPVGKVTPEEARRRVEELQNGRPSDVGS
ncbi:NAD(P)H-dependent oxidoreductase subunit E [Chloroflexota bacterium]